MKTGSKIVILHKFGSFSNFDTTFALKIHYSKKKRTVHRHRSKFCNGKHCCLSNDSMYDIPGIESAEFPLCKNPKFFWENDQSNQSKNIPNKDPGSDNVFRDFMLCFNERCFYLRT